MEILVLLIIVYACKKGFTDTKHAAAKSRKAYMASADKRFPDMPAGKRAAHAVRHDLGWGLSQLGHGFPATRNGFMTGWHQSRQAHHQAMLGRQEAKTAQLETRAGAVRQLQDYRERQQAALEQIRSGKAPSKPVVEVPDACPDCGAPSGLTHLASCRYAGGREGTLEGSSPRQFPVMLTATSKSGHPLNPFTGEPTDWAIVRDEEDLQRRLAAVEQDPDIGVRVDPLPTEDEAEQPETEGSPTGTTVTEDHWCPRCGRPSSRDGLCSACQAEYDELADELDFDDDQPDEEGSPSPEEGTPDGSSPNAPTGYSCGSAHVPSSWPADDVETARREAAYWSQGGTPQQVHQYHGENPGELLETYVNGELISPEEGRELDEQYASQREHIRQRHADRGPLGIPFSPGGTTVTEDHWDDPLPGEDSEHVVGHPGSPADVAVVGNRQWAEDIAREESKNGGRVIVSPRGLGTEPVAAFVNGEAVPLEPAEEGSRSPEEGTPEGTSSSTPETSPTSTASTEGTTMAGDTSYNEIDQGLTQDHDTAETLAAEQQQAAAQQEQAANAARSALAKTNAMIDAAEGLKLDTATTSELMEHAEAQREAAAASDAAHEAHLAALAAHQRVMETSQTGQTTLRTNHGQYQQAHDDSPVDSADAEFYNA